MKSPQQIISALNRLSSFSVKSRPNEDIGVFYGRMNYADGLRDAAIEIANWIVSDEDEELKSALENLKDDNTKLSSNGRSFNLKLTLDADLVTEIDKRKWKISDAANNALALFYLKQLRASNRLDKRQPTLRKGPFYGRTSYTIALDEDLHEALSEHVEELSHRYGLRSTRSRLVNGMLRNYLWALDVLAGPKPQESSQKLEQCCS